ncbi:uncharacterized protein LOC123597493 isoform X2 [Leopardus geoffroyi]|uniref:uncharacterized protein LOC123597493 isoform X2 n=1 Tax=Leopardus geoffroyi TaxID=46844 RepID=UPI001E25DBCD|nr:uncharacterized protein LOC123597493 isoform X2 [Leopardus geoffroyi]
MNAVGQRTGRPPGLQMGDSSTLEISILTFLLLIPRLFTPRTLPAARPSNNGHVDACPELRCFAGLSPMLPAALQGKEVFPRTHLRGICFCFIGWGVVTPGQIGGQGEEIPRLTESKPLPEA